MFSDGLRGLIRCNAQSVRCDRIITLNPAYRGSEVSQCLSREPR